MAESLYHQPSLEEANVLRDLSTKLRIHSIKMTAASKSGHPTSCSSMAEVMSVLFFKVMKYKDPRVHKEQRDPASDRFILSKVAADQSIWLINMMLARVTLLQFCMLHGLRLASSPHQSCSNCARLTRTSRVTPLLGYFGLTLFVL